MTKLINLLLTLALFCSATALRLHMAAPTLYVDNLAQSNQNYFFGSLSVISYYDGITKYMSANALAQNCPPSIPYANYSNGNLSCFACAPIQTGINVSTAKVLFDVQTRKCQVCSAGKTAICDQLLKGTYIFPVVAPPPAPANASANVSANASAAVPPANVSNISNVSNASVVAAGVANVSSNISNVSNVSAVGAVNGTLNISNSTNVTKIANLTANISANGTNITNVSKVLNASNVTALNHTNITNVTNGTNVSANVSHIINSTNITNATNITNLTHIANTTNLTANATLNNTKLINATNITNITNLSNISAANAKVKAPIFVTNGCPSVRPLYDPATGLCNVCPPNTHFNNVQQKCLPTIYSTNPAAPGLILTNLSQLNTLNANIQKKHPSQVVQHCPLSKPYCQNNVCISCGAGQYFMVATGLCVYGCPKGYSYDKRVLKCMPSLYYSDVNAAFLVSQIGDYKAWRAKTLYRASTSPLMTPCPISTPYEVKGSCIACPGQLFNIDSSTCVSCSRGRVYDPTKRRCNAVINNSPSFATYTASIL